MVLYVLFLFYLLLFNLGGLKNFMDCKKEGKIIVLRLYPNEKIHDMIKEACKKYLVDTGVVLSGIGQLKNFQLGYFKEKGDYSPQFFDKPHELLNLSGNIVKKDKEYLLHLHAVLGNENKKTIGGHLIEGKIEVTNEIFLIETDLNLSRTIDDKTGLKSLYIGS